MPLRPSCSLVAAVFFLLSPALGAATRRDELIRSANQAYLKRDFAQADRFYYEAARLQPLDAGALYGVGACEFLLGRTATARAWAELSLTRDPSSYRIQSLLGHLGSPTELLQAQREWAAGRPAAALPLYQTAAQDQPVSGLAWRGQALCLAALGRAEEASAALQRAEALEPNCLDLPAVRDAVERSVDEFLRQADPSSYHMRRGVRRFRAGDSAGAEAEFLQVTALQGDDAQAWYHLALARWKQDKAEGTHEALERCLALDPAHSGALYLKAAYLARAGQTEEARGALRALSASRDPAGFSSLAVRSLSQLPPPESGGWHAYLRLLGGPASSVSNNGISDTTQASLASQDYLRLSYDGWASTPHPFNLAYAAYLTPSQPQGADWGLGQPYHAADALLRWKAAPAYELAGGWSGSLRSDSVNGLNYYSNAAKLELDAKVLGLQPLALGLEALAERFPTYGPYDSDSALVTLAGTWMDARGNLVVLTLGGRLDEAAEPAWSYRNGSVNLYARLMLPETLSLSLSAQWQPQLYPFASDGGDGHRVDVQRYLDPELTLGLPWGFNVFVGDQWSVTRSNVGYYSSASNLAYAGLSWSR